LFHIQGVDAKIEKNSKVTLSKEAWDILDKYHEWTVNPFLRAQMPSRRTQEPSRRAPEA